MILPGPSGRAQTKFEIRVPASVRNEPLTGRVYVIITRDSTREPRTLVARVGAPLFGHDVERLAAGAPAYVDGSDLGTPVFDMADLPAGDYWVQPFVNVYSEFKRADGHVVWMHDDQWEGQNWSRSPGNIYGAPQKVHFDPRAKAVVKLVADRVIPPIVVAADNEYVQRFKFQSPSLTKFWGRPIYLGATVLLPRDYKTATISYPVNYIQGHFGLAAPYGFEAAPGGRGGRGRARPPGPSFHDVWLADNFPRIIAVTFQHPTPYFDDSYAVNSVNSGPYGDAIMNELIPEIEKRYRAIREPWARWLSGGSTGGWESLALQIYHPDFFGGTWSYCPDPVTFTDVEGVNMYKDDNAFFKKYSEWQLTPTVNSREVNGEIRQTAQQRYWMELVNGTHGPLGHGTAGRVGGHVGTDRRGRLLQARGRSAQRLDRPRRRAVLEGQLRPALLPPAQLEHRGAEARGQDPRVRRQHGQLLPRPRDARARGVDEDHAKPALRGLFRVRRPEAALLERARHERGPAAGDGASTGCGRCRRGRRPRGGGTDRTGRSRIARF